MHRPPVIGARRRNGPFSERDDSFRYLPTPRRVTARAGTPAAQPAKPGAKPSPEEATFCFWSVAGRLAADGQVFQLVLVSQDEWEVVKK